RAAQETGTYLVHLSSGCIFHSQNSADEKTEESIPNPLSYYMVSKVQAEEALLRRARENGLRVLILRPRQLLSAVPHAKNILAKMTIFTKFHDKDNSMTVIEDLMWVTDELVRRGRTGIYHVVNPGVTTPFRIAQMIREVINPDMQITQLSKEEIDAMYPVKRADTIMSTAKLNREGIFLIPIEQRVRQLLTVLRDNLLNEQARDILAETKAHDEARKSK
ncbi:MAG TPA: sugar nucleotide-binding protein, partial [Flavobacterium sp.]|nr:sugar nucleotide-binding protein [Flavobacterium sp.]